MQLDSRGFWGLALLVGVGGALIGLHKIVTPAKPAAPAPNPSTDGKAGAAQVESVKRSETSGPDFILDGVEVFLPPEG